MQNVRGFHFGRKQTCSSPAFGPTSNGLQSPRARDAFLPCRLSSARTLLGCVRSWTNTQLWNQFSHSLATDLPLQPALRPAEDRVEWGQRPVPAAASEEYGLAWPLFVEVACQKAPAFPPSSRRKQVSWFRHLWLAKFAEMFPSSSKPR